MTLQWVGIVLEVLTFGTIGLRHIAVRKLKYWYGTEPAGHLDQNTGFFNKSSQTLHLFLNETGLKRFGTKSQRQSCAIATHKTDLAKNQHAGKSFRQRLGK